MKACFHEIVFCNSYGKSCRLCGKALEGYGVVASFPGKQEVTIAACMVRLPGG